MREINPLLIDDVTETELLLTLMDSNKLRVVWTKNTDYFIQDEKIRLTNTLLIKDILNDHICFRVIGNESLGVGKFGDVYPIVTCTVSLTGLNTRIDNILVVKIQKHTSHNDNPLVDLHNEYAKSRLVAHLAIEKPIIWKESKHVDHSFLVMKKIQGVTLDYLLKHQPSLSSIIRLQITHAVLNAFKQQIVDKNLVHRDIKPKNIMINIGLDEATIRHRFDADLILPCCEIYFIDFGFAQYRDEDRHLLCGSLWYQAPEGNSTVFHDERLDVFSVGRVLQMLWGFDSQIITKNGLIHNVYTSFFSKENHFFSKQALIDITQTLINMTQDNFTQRWYLNDVITSFYVLELVMKHPNMFSSMKHFRQDLLHWAENTGHISEEKGVLILSIIKTHISIFEWPAFVDHNTLLCWAFRSNNALMINMAIQNPTWARLLKYKHCKTGWTLLHEIAFAGHKDFYHELNAIDRDVKSSLCNTPLFLAVKRQHTDMCLLLLESGADANIRGEHDELPLTIAAKNGNSTLCKLLLDHGADPWLINGNGKSAEAIWLATWSEQPNVFNTYTRQAYLELRKVQIFALLDPESSENNTAFNDLRKQINNASFTKMDAPEHTADDLLRKIIVVWDNERIVMGNYSNRLFSPVLHMPLPQSVQTVKALLRIPFIHDNRPTEQGERRIAFTFNS